MANTKNDQKYEKIMAVFGVESVEGFNLQSADNLNAKIREYFDTSKRKYGKKASC